MFQSLHFYIPRSILPIPPYHAGLYEALVDVDRNPVAGFEPRRLKQETKCLFQDLPILGRESQSSSTSRLQAIRDGGMIFHREERGGKDQDRWSIGPRQKSFGTFWAPFGSPVRTHVSRWYSIGIDIIGESRQDGFGISLFQAFGDAGVAGSNPVVPTTSDE